MKVAFRKFDRCLGFEGDSSCQRHGSGMFSQSISILLVDSRHIWEQCDLGLKLLHWVLFVSAVDMVAIMTGIIISGILLVAWMVVAHLGTLPFCCSNCACRRCRIRMCKARFRV